MIRIALTGPSGAGKGYAAKLLEKRGIAVLDTDSVVHGLYAEGDLPIRISEMFGEQVLSPDGSVNRKALGKIVFQDKEALSALNRVVHEAVKRKTELWLRKQQKGGAEMAAVDAPQLFEAGMQGDFDLVVSVIADDEVRLLRICQRDGIEREQALLRMKNQMSAEQYSRKSQVTIVNNGTEDLVAQIDKLINYIMIQYKEDFENGRKRSEE